MINTTTSIPDTPEELAAPPRVIGEIAQQMQGKWGGTGEAPPSTGHVSVITGWDLSTIDFLGSLYFLQTGDEVAAVLRDSGFKGDRSILESCPLANMIKSYGTADVEVDPTGINIRCSNGEFVRLRYGPGMIEFVTNFDNGLYPDLVA